jgi:hypothetical protein
MSGSLKAKAVALQMKTLDEALLIPKIPFTKGMGLCRLFLSMSWSGIFEH